MTPTPFDMAMLHTAEQGLDRDRMVEFGKAITERLRTHPLPYGEIFRTLNSLMASLVATLPPGTLREEAMRLIHLQLDLCFQKTIEEQAREAAAQAPTTETIQ